MTRRRQTAALSLTALLSMAHVGSPDTFFTGKAGPYDVRVSVRLPGVIPGRAQVAVRVVGATSPNEHQVAVRAGQWNVGLQGAPPPEPATPVSGDPALYAAELWLMTPSSYQLAVDVNGPSGSGTAIVPVMALATAQRPMPPWLGIVLAALGLFLSVGFLTIIATAVRESVLPPGEEPDAARRRRARWGTAVSAIGVALILWGGNVWWAAEAGSYGEFVLYRPFATESTVARRADRQVLTLGIRDNRWTGTPVAASRYNALLPDHGKLMHLFLVREGSLDAFAHLHPVARTAEALDFDVDVPPLPAGRYRVYGDIVHESGYAQTLVSTADIGESGSAASSDPDDSWFIGPVAAEASTASFALPDGSQLVWLRGDESIAVAEEHVLAFEVRDAGGAVTTVEPYMGMAAHVIVTDTDGSVFVHLHPAGSISMAALQKFAGAPASAGHASHLSSLEGKLAIPYAFPKAGKYRLWVQVKRGGRVMTGAYDLVIR
jgi:hypothetical protein